MLFCVLFGGCTEQPPSRSYINTLYGFSVDPPSGWQQIDSKSPDVAVCFSPGDSSNSTLVIAVPFILGEGRALSTLADEIEQNLSESGVNYSVLFRDWRLISNLNAYEIAYSVEQEGEMLYVKQVAILKTRTVFLMTFTAPTSVSSLYLPVVDQSVESFL